MAVLNHIWIEWSLSPRIIVVEAPYTEVTLQDLVDTLRHLEADLSAMDDPKLINASGKEDLGGGVSVGITAELQNARLMFEARSTPISTGNTCSVAQKGTKLTASGATFVSDGVEVGDTAFNATTGAMGTIYTVTEESLSHFQLSGGSRNDWQIGDSVIVYHNAQCLVTGGNLTSVDENDASVEPIFQSPNVQVVRTSSASATFSEAEALQYSSFQNSVWIDILSSNSGIAYPNGNREFPVNNLTDAKTIATDRGFDTLHLLQSMVIDSGTDLTGFQLIGKSHVNTEITLASTAILADITLVNCKVGGVLDGGTHIVDCVVTDIEYVNGHIHNCGLMGTIQLSGNEDAVVADCYTIDQDNAPVIDMGVAGQSLAVPNYSGLLTITNLNSSSNEIGIGLNAGLITLASSLRQGTAIVSGAGLLTDNSQASFLVNSDGLMSKDTMAAAVWDEPIGGHLLADTTGHQMYHQAYDNIVHIDVLNGSSGTTFPTGTTHDPCDNLADALSIASAHFIATIHIVGNLTIDGEDITGLTIAADRSLGNSLTITSMTNTDACYFEDLTVSGALTGSTRFTTCVLGALTGYDGGAKDCLLTGTIEVVGSGANYFTNCDTYVTTQGAPKEINVGDNYLNLIRCRGSYSLTNKIGSNTTSIDLVAGGVSVASSCTAGIVAINGISDVVDQSDTGCTVIVKALSPDYISETIWADDTADRLLGLMQENQYLDQTVYDTYNGQKLLTTGRIRLYSDEASVGTASNCTASYLITATWTGDEMDTYKVTKVGN